MELTDKLRRYIAIVEAETGKTASFHPAAQSELGSGTAGFLKLGPSFDGLHIEYRDSLSVKELEKTLAHELTHGRLFYAMSYHGINAPDDIANYVVQHAADVMDFIDDVIVETLIQREGFPPITRFQLDSIANNARVLTVAKNRSQVTSPYPNDPIRAEITFVGQYVYAWALPRYATLDDETTNILEKFRRTFPQVLAREYSKAKQIKSLMQSYDIFKPEERDKVLLGALRLWKLDNIVNLTQYG